MQTTKNIINKLYIIPAILVLIAICVGNTSRVLSMISFSFAILISIFLFIIDNDEVEYHD